MADSDADSTIEKLREFDKLQESRLKFRKTNWDEAQQTVTLLGAIIVSSAAAFYGKWEIAVTVITALLGYTFAGRTIKSMRNGG